MKKQILSLFLTLLILISLEGVISIVGKASASHVTIGIDTPPLGFQAILTEITSVT
jgi:hypothetical protein